MKNYEKEFPYIKTKTRGVNQSFDLNDPKERKKYFKLKIGREIDILKKHFKKNTFIAYMLGKKNSGKGTYTKLMMEIFGKDKIGHISVGDTIRKAHKEMSKPRTKKVLMDYLKNNYRGYISLDEAINTLLGRSTNALLPTEFTLSLVKREIDQMPKKSLFVDGFPRNLDQISYSLYFRDLINYREDIDIFVAIDIPEYVIDARMKGRVICPKCQVPRGLELLITKKIEYDDKKKEVYLRCDNPECNEPRMVRKEGDELGIEAFRERMNLDDQLIDKAFALYGIPKILVRNSIPIDIAKKYVDDYEITPKYIHKVNKKTKKVQTSQKPWVAKDDRGRKVYSLLAAPVIVTLIKQLPKALGIKS